MRFFVLAGLLAGLALAAITPAAHAERATADQMELVCTNFLSYVLHEQGQWAGDPSPWIRDVQDITVGGEVLARNYTIAPLGHVVVPVMMEMPPIMVYSEEYEIDVNDENGFPALLREVLADRAARFVAAYGNLDVAQPATGVALFGPQDREKWARYAVPADDFSAALASGAFSQRTQVGPLLTTSWHQSGPFNNDCPMGDGGRCVVGCVATGTAQLMRYWAWPPVGYSSYCYFWDGDQSCGGNYGGGQLCVTLNDPYDWANMPNNCQGGCNATQQAALAELNYEVGVCEDMDYGRCASGTLETEAESALRDCFRYDPSIDREFRYDYDVAGWFQLIQREIDAGRPMLYRITSHLIVCDGWRDDSGPEYHMNYGWGGPYTAWYAIDHLYISDDPMTETLIRNIFPHESTVFALRADGTGDLPNIQAAVDVAIDGNIIELADGVYTGNGNRDVDLRGKRLTIRSATNDFRNCIIDCQGSAPAPHRAFLIQSGETVATTIEGITIRGGYAGEGGAILCAGASAATFRNCRLTGNTASVQGGAIACRDASNAVIEHCVLDGNTALSDGGALACLGSQPQITSCTFSGNSAPQGSAITVIAPADLLAENTILTFAPAGEPVFCNGGATAALACCDVFGNAAGDWVGAIAGQDGMAGNFSADPIFCDVPNGNFTIDASSPCVPFGPVSPGCDQVGALGVGCGSIMVYADGHGSFATIQAGINAAIEGGVVLLDDGVFTGDGNRDVDFGGKAVTLRSASGNPAACVIDCQGTQSEFHRGFTIMSGEGPETVIEGITVANGYSDIGAGAMIDNASPTLRNVVFADNYADFGGATRCRNVCTALFESVIFRGNGARVGGGAYCLGSGCVPTFRNCTFYANRATNLGAGMRTYDFSDPIVDNTIIAFSTQGISISCVGGAEPVLSCTDIYGNAGGDWSGGISDQAGLRGNFSADPLFCDAANGVLTIDSASPCAPGHSPDDCGLVGAGVVDCGLSDVPVELVAAHLMLAVPSPFSAASGATIRFNLPGSHPVAATLGIYDLSGRLVRQLVNGVQPAGGSAATWDGADDARHAVASGVYFCRLSSDGEQVVRSLVLLR